MDFIVGSWVLFRGPWVFLVDHSFCCGATGFTVYCGALGLIMGPFHGLLKMKTTAKVNKSGHFATSANIFLSQKRILL